MFKPNGLKPLKKLHVDDVECLNISAAVTVTPLFRSLPYALLYILRRNAHAADTQSLREIPRLSPQLSPDRSHFHKAIESKLVVQTGMKCTAISLTSLMIPKCTYKIEASSPLNPILSGTSEEGSLVAIS